MNTRLVVTLIVVAVLSVVAMPAQAENNWAKALIKGAIIYALEKPTDRKIALAGDELSGKFRVESSTWLDADVTQITKRLVDKANDDLKIKDPKAKMLDYPEVRVIDQKGKDGKPEINAFAIPGTHGGHVYVTEGMLTFLKTKDPAGWKDDLAGILAHELSHIFCGHARSQFKNAISAQILAGTVLEGSNANNSIVTAVTVLEFLREARFSRKQENEADERGLALSDSTGFDPAALPRTFRLMRENEGDIPKCLTTLTNHPSLASREKRLSKKIEEKPSGRLPAPTGVENPQGGTINVPDPDSNSSLSKTIDSGKIAEVRLILSIKKFEGREPTAGREQFVAWINQGLVGSGISVVLRGEEYDRALAEQNLAGVDPATRPQSCKFLGATGEAEIIASCADGYREKNVGYGRQESQSTKHERKYFAETRGTITNFSFETLAVTEVTESANSEAVVRDSSTEVHIPGFDYRVEQGGDYEQPVTDEAWRGLAEKLAEGLKEAFERLPKNQTPSAKPLIVEKSSERANYVVFHGGESVKKAKVGQIFGAFAKDKDNTLGRQVGKVEVVAINDSASIANYYGINPDVKFQGCPIGKWLSWNGSAQDVQSGLIFIAL